MSAPKIVVSLFTGLLHTVAILGRRPADLFFLFAFGLRYCFMHRPKASFLCCPKLPILVTRAKGMLFGFDRPKVMLAVPPPLYPPFPYSMNATVINEIFPRLLRQLAMETLADDDVIDV